MFCKTLANTGEGIMKKKKICEAAKASNTPGLLCNGQEVDDNAIKLKSKKSDRNTSAELREETLFQQPAGTHLGDCPICFVKLPIDPFKSTLQSCCSSLICKACCHANKRREANKKLCHTCPLCRQRIPKKDTEINANCEKRVAANDPVAIQETGKKHYRDRNFRGAFDCWSKAADLGNVDAIYLLSLLYRDGRGVKKNEEMEWYVLEEAAIRGHVGARFTLAHNENTRRGNIERAVKHLFIGTRLGCDRSMKALEQCYADGKVDKDVFVAAHDAHRAAKDEMNSPQREQQANYEKSIENYFCASK